VMTSPSLRVSDIALLFIVINAGPILLPMPACAFEEIPAAIADYFCPGCRVIELSSIACATGKKLDNHAQRCTSQDETRGPRDRTDGRHRALEIGFCGRRGHLWLFTVIASAAKQSPSAYTPAGDCRGALRTPRNDGVGDVA